jgi:hypothetical protein
MISLEPELYFKGLGEGILHFCLSQEVHFNENCLLDVENTQLKLF